MKNLLVLLAFIAFITAGIFGQAIPKQINYQGVLKDASGVVVANGDYNITFKLYDAVSGGTALWTETKLVNVVDGIISTKLGSATPLVLPFDASYWLGVTIAAGTELTPRIELASVPYSYMSMSLPDGTLTEVKIAGGQVVKSLNTLKDSVTLIAGSNISIVPSGNDLTINAVGVGSGTIGGSGTANYIPLFTETTTLGNSLIYQTGGGNIGIGTITPAAKLDIAGSDAAINGLTVGRGTGSVSFNSAFGYRALYANTSGYQNTAIGYQSLCANTTGYQNTAIGYSALYFNTIGYQNTANGYRSLYNNTEGFCNTASGYSALYNNTTGDYNTAKGYQSLCLNTIGVRNTAIGYRALYANTRSDNTANGYAALQLNTEGTNNTAFGGYALYVNTTQLYNTAIGYSAGDFCTSSQGTFLGCGAYPTSDGYVNIMGIGWSARPSASNQVRIGNTYVTSIGGYAGWTNLSDGRYKRSIQENVKGLDFIMKLRPVTYKLDVNRLASDLQENKRRDENGNITFESSETDIKSRNEKSQIVYTGFVAQEVEKAAKDLGFDFSGVDAPKNENDFYGLRYAEFVVPLVKAVQEQQKIIEDLTKRIEELEKR